MAARQLVFQSRIIDRLIFRRERRLLSSRCPFCRADAAPLSAQVRVLLFVMRPRAANRRREHRCHYDCADRKPELHGYPSHLRPAGFRRWPEQKSHWPEIGLPSLNLVFIRAQAPPGAPLRNGSIVNTNSSPGLSVLADMPSRARMLGDGPSRFHTVLAPSFPLTSTRIKLCGLVYRNSTTVPAISIECS